MSHKALGLLRAIFKIDFILTVLVAFILAMIFRTVLYEFYKVPSGSMTPNLIKGDYLFAEKFTYGYGKYSIPYDLYLLKNRYFAKEPERGDIVIFRKENDSQFYVKRLIGLPGDTIKIYANKMMINDQIVERVKIGDYESTADEKIYDKYQETLPNGVSYFTINKKGESLEGGASVSNIPSIYQVPDNHYFLMGDNRHNSSDSRFLNKISYTPAENIVATPKIIVWDGNFSFSIFNSNPHESRFFKVF